MKKNFVMSKKSSTFAPAFAQGRWFYEGRRGMEKRSKNNEH